MNPYSDIDYYTYGWWALMENYNPKELDNILLFLEQGM